MVVRDVKQRLREAENLFAAGKFHESLALLDELEKIYPGEKRIVYGRAMCLARLNRRAEAMLLCDDMIVRYHDARAEVLKQRIMELPDAPSPETTSRGRSGRFLQSLGSQRAGFGRWLLVMAVLGLLAAAVPYAGATGLGILINQGVLPVSWGGAAGIFIVFCLAMGLAGLMALWAGMGVLPGDSLAENLRTVFFEQMRGQLLACIPVAGWVVWAMRLNRRYDFSMGVALCSVCWCILTGVAALLVTMMALGFGGIAWLAHDFI